MLYLMIDALSDALSPLLCLMLDGRLMLSLMLDGRLMVERCSMVSLMLDGLSDDRCSI